MFITRGIVGPSCVVFYLTSAIKLEGWGWDRVSDLYSEDRMVNGGWRIADRKKLSMTKCGRKNNEWKNVNDNARIMKSWWGKFNYNILFVAVDFSSVTLLSSKQYESFDVVEEEQSLMIKGKSSLTLFDQIFSVFPFA